MGHTVNKLLEMALGEKHSNFPTNYWVHVDGMAIPEEWRDRVHVRSARSVTFSPHMHGGDILHFMALITVSVITLITAPYLTPLIFSTT